MALINDIMDEMERLGLGTGGGGLAGLGDITSEQIMAALTSSFGLQAGDLSPGQFPTINKDVLTSAFAKTYSPGTEATTSTLLGDLTKKMGGPEAVEAFGGFAGSGQQSQFGQQARDVYGRGAGDILSKQMGARSAGVAGIWDIINQWKESALKIRG